MLLYSSLVVLRCRSCLHSDMTRLGWVYCTVQWTPAANAPYIIVGYLTMSYQNVYRVQNHYHRINQYNKLLHYDIGFKPETLNLVM